MSGRAATTSIIEGRCALSVGDPGTPLPKGWSRVPLLSIAELGTGHTPSRSRPEYWDGGVPWIAIPDARDNHTSVITETSETVSQLGLENSAARILPANTVGLSRTASVGYVFIMGRPMATSQDFVTWTCSEALDPRFLMYALLAEGDDIRRFGKGSTHTTIYFPEVKAFHLSLPPRHQQHAIAAKLDSLRARSARACHELDLVPKLIERYKQAILAAQIDAASIDAPESTLGELLDVLTSGSRDWAKYYDKGSGVFVLAGNVKPMAFDATPRRFIDPPRDGPDARRSRIAKDDILLTIVGAGTGQLCRVPNAVEDYFVCQSVALLRLNNPKLSRWVELFLNADAHGRGQIQELIYGQGRPHLGFDDIKRIAIRVPSERTLQSAMQKIEAAFDWLDKIATEHARAAHLLPKLDQAILAKAFRGELVPQDPNDEPATELLKRIRADRAGDEHPRNRRRST